MNELLLILAKPTRFTRNSAFSRVPIQPQLSSRELLRSPNTHVLFTYFVRVHACVASRQDPRKKERTCIAELMCLRACRFVLFISSELFWAVSGLNGPIWFGLGHQAGLNNTIIYWHVFTLLAEETWHLAVGHIKDAPTLYYRIWKWIILHVNLIFDSRF